LAVATSSPAGAESLVRGRASYRERVALRPGVVFEATLEDVSRADAQAVVLGSVRVEDVGAVPIPFEILYDPAQIDERRSYVVRGRLLAGERLLFTTDRAAPVLTRGHGNEVELLLVRVPSTPPPGKVVSPP
jgi:putative lipoprotein